jgi:hypothetical protein
MIMNPAGIKKNSKQGFEVSQTRLICPGML